MPELKIIISAENQKALEELKQLQDKLFQLQETVKNYKGDWPLTHTIETVIPRIQARIGELQGTLSKAGVAFDNFGNDTQKIALGSNKAGLALNDLSRIAQDAPYGFIGISNNINPMLESFQRLQKESGSTSGALKAMASSLIGPAGIGLAIGVVSSLLVVFSKQITEAFQKPTDKLKEFYDELNKINAKLFDVVGQAQANRTVGVGYVDAISGGGDIKLRESALTKLKELFRDNADLQKAKITDDKTFLLSLVNTAASQQEWIGKEKLNNESLKTIYSDRFKLEQERADKLKLITGPKLVSSVGGVTSEFSVKKQEKLVNDDIDARIEKINKELLPKAELAGKRIQQALLGFNFTNENGNKESKKALDEKIALLEYDIRKTTEWANEQIKIHDKITASSKKATTIGWRDTVEGQRNPDLDVPDWMIRQMGGKNVATEKISTSVMPELMRNYIVDGKERVKVIKEQQDAYKEFAKTLAGDVTNALMNVFDTMVKGGDVLKSLGESFLKLAEDIGAAIIKEVIFKAVLASISPATALTSSGISPALGDSGTGWLSALYNITKGGASIGSAMNTSNISSNSMGNSGEFTLKGNDLVLALQRSNYSLNLKRGS